MPAQNPRLRLRTLAKPDTGAIMDEALAAARAARGEVAPEPDRFMRPRMTTAPTLVRVDTDGRSLVFDSFRVRVVTLGRVASYFRLQTLTTSVYAPRP